MTKIPDFHSINEPKKPVEKRVYQDNNACAPGRDIPQSERRSGTGGYRHCDDCTRETNLGR
jgi:hypothetical protein